MNVKRSGIILWANQILACVRSLEERKQEKKPKNLVVVFFFSSLFRTSTSKLIYKLLRNLEYFLSFFGKTAIEK